MRTIALAALVVCTAAAPVRAQIGPRRVGGDEVERRTTTVVKKERWAHSLEELKARAASEKKLIFWLQLVGDLGGGL